MQWVYEECKVLYLLKCEPSYARDQSIFQLVAAAPSARLIGPLAYSVGLVP